MPSVAALRARLAAKASEDGTAEPACHLLRLYLPSSLPATTVCDPTLKQFEWRLRSAQATDALVSLRHHLRIQAAIGNFKARNDRGQTDNLRSNDQLKRNQVHVQSDVSKYRGARAALVILGRQLGKTSSELYTPTLLEADVRQMMVGLPGESEGRRTLSWIWRTDGAEKEKDDPGYQDGELFLAS